MSPVVTRVLGALSDRGLRKTGAGWQARCPAHDDEGASLSISEDETGRVVLHCTAGCATPAIVETLRLQPRDVLSDAAMVGSGREREPGCDDDDETPSVIVATPVRKSEHAPTETDRNAAGRVDRPWDEPREIVETLLPVPGFDAKLLPEPIRHWVADAADRTQCPPEYSAAGAVVALGSIIGRGVAIRPKQHDDWTVVSNLWGAVVGRPGTLKSPALAEALRHVRHLEAEAHERHAREAADWALTSEITKAKRNAILKKAAKPGANANAIKAEALAVHEPLKPVEGRFLLNDSTVEKLGEILAGNPRGVLVVRDELTGWLGSLDKDGHETDRAFYLEAWNGTGAFTYDRIGRGTVRIPAACVSLLGGIQPGPFSRYFRSALHSGAGADGLVQRFQVLVYPDQPSAWRMVDRWPDSAARQTAFDVFKRLADPCLAETVRARNDDGELPHLRFDAEAQELFGGWYSTLITRARQSDAEAFASHLVKYASLMPALALIFHLVEELNGGPVSLRAAQMAAAWCDFLEAHARRVYHAATGANVAAARTVLTRLKAGALPSPFLARDLYRKQWAGIATPAEADAALDVLEEHGWVSRVELPAGHNGGHPRVEYHLHPSLVAARRAAA